MINSMAKSPEKLAEKLALLISKRGISNSALARAVGITPPQIGYYLAGTTPGAGVLVGLAKALDVPMEYLADDNIPANDIPARLQFVEDVDLMDELVRRYVTAAQAQDALFSEAEKTDWVDIARRVVALPPEASVPDDLLASMKLAARIASNTEALPIDKLELLSRLEEAWFDPNHPMTEEMLPVEFYGRMEKLTENAYLDRVSDYFMGMSNKDSTQRMKAFRNLAKLLNEQPTQDIVVMTKRFPLSNTMACKQAGTVEDFAASVIDEASKAVLPKAKASKRKWSVDEVKENISNEVSAVIIRRLDADITALKDQILNDLGKGISTMTLADIGNIVSGWTREFSEAANRSKK